MSVRCKRVQCVRVFASQVAVNNGPHYRRRGCVEGQRDRLQGMIKYTGSAKNEVLTLQANMSIQALAVSTPSRLLAMRRTAFSHTDVFKQRNMEAQTSVAARCTRRSTFVARNSNG